MSSNPRVLIVDDDQRNREMLAETLQQANFFVELANGGAEAIDKGGGGKNMTPFSATSEWLLYPAWKYWNHSALPRRKLRSC